MGSTVTSFDDTILLAPPEYENAGAHFNFPARQRMLPKPNPFDGQRPVLEYVKTLSTYGSGTSVMNVYCVAYSVAATGKSSETATLVFQGTNGATTVEEIFAVGESTTPLPASGVRCPEGQKMLVRLDNSAAAGTIDLFASGYVYR